MAKRNDDAIQGGQTGGQLDASSTNTAKVSDQGGAGIVAGPAGAQTTDELIQAGAAASRQQMAEVRDFLKAEEGKGSAPENLTEAMRRWDERGYGPKAEFRDFFPNLTAAIEAWQASGATEPPTVLRIVAKVDGFRRSGLTHSKSGAEHPIDAFPSPVQLEQLFAEPNLVVSFA